MTQGNYTNAERADNSTYPVLFIQDLDTIQAQEMLIEGILPEKVSGYLYGDDSTCKTGIAGETGLRMTFGLDWFGMSLKSGAVAIVAGEGDADVRKLVKAFTKYHEQTYDLTEQVYPLVLIPEAVMIDNDRDIKKLIHTLKQALQDIPLSLLIFDTLAACLETASESDNPDMSRVNNRMRILQNVLGCTTLIIHHAGKDATRGMRGASALRRNADVVLYIEALENYEYAMTVEKIKGRQKPKEAYKFVQKIVDLDTTDNLGTVETGYVLEYIGTLQSSTLRQQQNDTQIMLGFIEQGSLNNQEWLAKCKEQGISYQRFRIIKKELLQWNTITESKGVGAEKIYTYVDPQEIEDDLTSEIEEEQSNNGQYLPDQEEGKQNAILASICAYLEDE